MMSAPTPASGPDPYPASPRDAVPAKIPPPSGFTPDATGSVVRRRRKRRRKPPYLAMAIASLALALLGIAVGMGFVYMLRSRTAHAARGSDMLSGYISD